MRGLKKTRWKRWISLIIVLTMVMVPTVSAQAKSSTCHVDPIYDDNGNRTGFRSVIIDDMEYYDIDGGAKENRASAASQLTFLMRTLQSEDGSNDGKSLIRNWADPA